MKIRKLNIYIIIGCLGLSLQACKDFVDLEPLSDATSATAYSTKAEAEAALTGVYETFQSSEYYIWDNVVLGDIRSDNFYAGGDDAQIFAIDKLEITPSNSRLFNSWSQIYNGISKANTVLQKVPLIQDAQLDVNNRRQQILGEASFLRAYHYYNLVTLWGGVPLVTEPVSSTSPSETNKPRATETEVYNQIITDLDFALSRLPDSYGDAGIDKARATRGAVNALLAKVYAQKPEKDYTKVLEYSNAVINSAAGYQLLNTFSQLFDGAHYNNAESILEVQFTGGNEANWGPQMLLPPSISGDSWRKFATPSKDLVQAFDSEGDVLRKNASILFENAPWSDEYWSLNVGGSIPFAYKWKSANGWASTNRQYVLRLADIILLKAEALNELNRPAEAKDVLDLIRLRAGIARTTATTQAPLRDAILKERRLELVQEGQRWNDLVRYGKMMEVMTNLNEIDLRNNQRVNYNAGQNDRLLPIPQQELNRNGNLEQNPGYN